MARQNIHKEEFALKSYEQESSLEAELPASDDATPAAEEVEDPSQLSSVAASPSEVEDRSSVHKSGFKPPTRDQLLLWVPFLAVFLLGAVLRFWGLGDKPLHHDESLHAYYSLQLLQNLHMWSQCQQGVIQCYKYDPLLHGPFQFHFIALVYQLSQWLGAADNGVNTTTVRILAATLGSLIVGLPYFLREHMGRIAAL
ncbi:MAG TPA: hypothetical protein VFN23_02830, partial [Ktedonobacteraceae bacterium]|nr:hypothetical protein [Ktedonobacteraceae bacterium]